MRCMYMVYVNVYMPYISYLSVRACVRLTVVVEAAVISFMCIGLMLKTAAAPVMMTMKKLFCGLILLWCLCL